LRRRGKGEGEGKWGKREEGEVWEGKRKEGKRREGINLPHGRIKTLAALLYIDLVSLCLYFILQ